MPSNDPGFVFSILSKCLKPRRKRSLPAALQLERIAKEKERGRCDPESSEKLPEQGVGFSS